MKAVHVQDLAYQKHVLECAGLRISGCYLVHVFVGYERGRELSPQDLFCISPVDDSRCARSNYAAKPGPD